MRRKKTWNVLKVILVTFSFLSCQRPVVLTADVLSLSTTTRTPDGVITTTKSKATEHEDRFKAEVADMLTLNMGLKNMKVTHEFLNSPTFIKMEEELSKLQEIFRTVEQFYGFRLQQDFSISCAYEYSKKKRFLMREFSTLFNECKDTVDNVDLLHFSKTDKESKMIIHACSERVRTLPRDVMNLVDHSYQISYVCAIQTVLSILEEMINAKYLSFIEKNSELLTQEMDYLLRNYEKYLGKMFPNENYTVTEHWKILNTYKVELAKISSVRNTNVLKIAIMNFTGVAKSIIKKAAPSSDKSDFPALAKLLRSQVYENHLKIPNLDDESIEHLAETPGVYKVVWINNHLKQIMAKLMIGYPESNPFLDDQNDLSKAVLFTETSTTFGKQCGQ